MEPRVLGTRALFPEVIVNPQEYFDVDANRQATLMNLSRGGVVDDQALAEALLAGRTGAVGLDVFEGEPAVTLQLLECRTAILPTHIASASRATQLRMARLAADNLIAALGFGPEERHAPNRVV